jgi:8-oxo-dGDP phosphatase
VKREVMEETGIDFEPTTLLMVESATGVWFRFVLTGNIIGIYTYSNVNYPFT